MIDKEFKINRKTFKVSYSYDVYREMGHNDFGSYVETEIVTHFINLECLEDPGNKYQYGYKGVKPARKQYDAIVDAFRFISERLGQ